MGDISGRKWINGKCVVVDKEKYRAWWAAYRERNRKKWRAYRKRYNKAWRKKNGYHNEEKWKRNNPDKHKIHKAVQRAMRTGRLKKRPCQVCKTNRLVIAHHNDYSRPLWVIFLCRPHHGLVHRMFTPEQLLEMNRRNTLRLIKQNLYHH